MNFISGFIRGRSEKLSDGVLDLQNGMEYLAQPDPGDLLDSVGTTHGAEAPLATRTTYADVTSRALPRQATSHKRQSSSPPPHSRDTTHSPKLHVENLTKDLTASRRRIAQLEKVNDELQAQHRLKDAEDEHRRRQACGYKSRADESMRELNEARLAFQDLQGRAYQLNAAFENLKKEYASLQAQFQQRETLYTTQSVELRTAQTFLGTADSIPGAQVVQAVRDLNTEIQNAAAMFSEEFRFVPPSLRSPATESTPSSVVLVQWLGGTLLDGLQKQDHSEDPTLVQMAVHALLAATATRYISDWSLDSDLETVVRALHSFIRLGEVQAVSGRWRALSARYLRLNSIDPENTGEGQVEDLASLFVALFAFAGCVDTPEELKDVITHKFAAKLRTITSQALRLGTILHEDVTSSDLQVIHLSAGMPFDPNLADDEYADEDDKGPSSGQPIMCTTDLGLVQISRLGESVNGYDQTESVLLKPKVALETALNKIFDEEEDSEED